MTAERCFFVQPARTDGEKEGEKMKFSCLPVSVFGDIANGRIALSDWPKLAKEIGLSGFDITISFLRDRTPFGLKSFREQLSVNELPCYTMSIYPDFTNPDPAYVMKEIIRAKSDIACASDIGVQNVRITAGQYYENFDEDAQLSQAVAAILECKKIADMVGITLLWENHSKPGAWENPDFNYHEGRLKKMAHALRGTGVYMNYDVANADLLGLGTGFLRECFPEIRSIHLNDVISKSPLKFCGVFHGSVPIAENLQVLKELSYDGIISVEEAAFEGTDGIRRYLTETKEMLRKYDFI